MVTDSPLTQSSTIIKINEILSTYHNNIPVLPSWDRATNAADAGVYLRYERFRNKFSDPSQVADREALAVQCEDDFVQRMQEFERNANHSVRYFHDAMHVYRATGDRERLHAEYTRPQLLEMARLGRALIGVRRIIREWERNYRRVYSDFRQFGPGETSRTRNGWTTELSKYLSGDFCCSNAAFDLLREQFKRNRLLRLRALYRGYKILRTERGLTPLRYAALYQWDLSKAKNEIFELGLRSLAKVKREPVCRFTSVPKNNKTNRGIAMPSLGNQIAETPVANGVGALLASIGNFLEEGPRGFDGQYYHKKAILNPGVATIDLSKGSDSNLMSVLEVLLGETKLLNDIKAVRPSVIETEHGLINLPIVAPMGFRICFVMMTMVLCAVACYVTGRTRVDRLDPSSPQVYGDDVIIPNENAHEFVWIVERLGYSVNKGKTFIGKPTRESCGGYVFDSTILRSYDIKAISQPGEVAALLNKVLLNFLHGERDAPFWLDLWRELRDCIGAIRTGPLPDNPEAVLGSFVMDPDPKSQECQGLLKWLHQQLQVTTTYVDTVRFENEVYEGCRRPWAQRFKNLLRIRNLSNVEETRRGGGSWKHEVFVVDSSGQILGTKSYLHGLRSRYVDSLRKEELKRYLRALKAPVGEPEWDLKSITELQGLPAWQTIILSPKSEG